MPVPQADHKSSARCGTRDDVRMRFRSRASGAVADSRLGSVASVSKIPIQPTLRKAAKSDKEKQSAFSTQHSDKEYCRRFPLIGADQKERSREFSRIIRIET